MITRRQLFRLLAAGLVTAPAVVDELLWTPKKTIFTAPVCGWDVGSGDSQVACIIDCNSSKSGSVMPQFVAYGRDFSEAFEQMSKISHELACIVKIARGSPARIERI